MSLKRSSRKAVHHRAGEQPVEPEGVLRPWRESALSFPGLVQPPVEIEARPVPDAVEGVVPSAVSLLPQPGGTCAAPRPLAPASTGFLHLAGVCPDEPRPSRWRWALPGPIRPRRCPPSPARRRGDIRETLVAEGAAARGALAWLPGPTSPRRCTLPPARRPARRPRRGALLRRRVGLAAARPRPPRPSPP